MKKIGIMSMERIHNYGSFLQAYALMKVIESLGHNVQFIDYKFEKKIINEKSDIYKKIKDNINIIQFIKKRKLIKKFGKKYDEDFLPMLNVSKYNYNYNKDIETLVIGSDEVFNCLQPYPVGYSRNLFGKEYEKCNVISYAASFGFTTLKDLKKYEINNEIKSLLLNFKSISVRDQNSYDIINELTKNKPNINLDPVLIYDFPKSNTKINYSNYILVYAYPGRFSRKEEKFIKNFAKKKNKTILSLGSYQKIANDIIIINPLDIFNYFEKADFVITDTFHGTIFSVKSKTNFCTIVRESNNNKLSHLLKSLDLETRKITNLSDIEKIYECKPNFTNTYKILANEKNKAYNYLKKNL